MPWLGIAVNVAGFVGIIAFLVGMIVGWDVVWVTGGVLCLPALMLPETRWWRRYWKRFD
jgi:hypothetical protein